MKITDLRTAIVSTLSAVSSGVDLTGADQVLQGLYAVPPRAGLPCVMLGGWTLASEPGPQLGRWQRTVTWRLIGWAPSSNDSPASRSLAIETLADAIVIALETATRTAGGAIAAAGAYDLNVVSVGGIDGMDGEQSGYAVFEVTVEFFMRADKLGGL